MARLGTTVAVADDVLVNGQPAFHPGYLSYHLRRFLWTLERLREIGAQRIIEVGAHPWAMTALLVDEPGMDLAATVSAEEVSHWPDDIGVQVGRYHIRTARGAEAVVTNYSANVERRLFDIPGDADTVLASEVVEHLIRSPHVMFLNINRWLPVGGKLLVTTPNGLQFSNPLRRQVASQAYRANVYERHSYVYRLEDLVELITLCGFKVIRAGYCELYGRQGPSRVYGWLARIPGRFFRERFMKTIYVMAEKTRDVATLERCPKVYDARGDWEYIARAR